MMKNLPCDSILGVRLFTEIRFEQDAGAQELCTDNLTCLLVRFSSKTDVLLNHRERECVIGLQFIVA
jgi:hypothetical protein